ncbi:melanoma inhibitory activity protein 2 isoform X2 [Ambystoma mexicanum]|uniref:melanoma inhibitory activity protein 2 isoform X2 n=1 Tax=Ambystoma mexicanum TaxID=8296 RepID=UPI0037E96D18
MAARKACGSVRLPVLVLLFLTGFRCEKILSQTKRCGDPGCESLMIRAQASRDYTGPDCRYLNFKFGEEILVYYKLSGTRDDLWQGSQGKKSGYFPKDAVNIEEVYISKEVEVPAKETDFICLDGGEYIFENEDSILHQKDTELDYLNPDTEPYLTVPEGELLKPTRISSDVEKGMNPISEQNEQDITVERIPSVLMPPKNDEQEPSDKPEIGENTNRDVLPEPVKDSWTVSGFAGWLGMGGKGEEKVLTPMSEPFQENTFHSRKIALSDEIILQKEDEEELETSTSSWFPSGFREFLPFGREETEQVLEEKYKASVAETQDNTLVEDSKESTVSIETEALKEDQDENESGDVDSKSKWFNLGLHNMFSFGNIAKDTLNVKDEQTNEDSNQIGVGESKQIMNTLKAGTSGDHESNLKIDGSERQEMLNDRARTDLNEHLDSNQNIAFMETSLSEEYQDTKGQGDISSNSWFNLGLDDILSFRESSKDSTMLKEELIEEAVNMTEMEGETQAVNPRETDSVLDTEEIDVMGRRVTEDIGDLETLNNLKEAETTPLTSAWYSNHLENILNLKMHTTTDKPRLAADEHSKEQVTGLYSTESSVDSILTEHADVEKISKEARSRKEGQGWYDNMYDNFIGFHRDLSDRYKREESAISDITEETLEYQLHTSPRPQQTLSTSVIKGTDERAHVHEGTQPSLICLNHLKHTWNAQSFMSNANGNTKRQKCNLASKGNPHLKNVVRKLHGLNANNLKLQAVNYLPEVAPNLVTSKNTASPIEISVQADRESDTQKIEASALMKKQEDLSNSPLASSVWQTDYVFGQSLATPAHVYHRLTNVINKRQAVCLDTFGITGTERKQHRSSENALKNVDNLVTEIINPTKESSAEDYNDDRSGDLSDNEQPESKEHTVELSSEFDVIKSDAIEIKGASDKNNMPISEEGWQASATQFNELSVKDSNYSLDLQALGSSFSQLLNINTSVDEDSTSIAKAFLSQEKKKVYEGKQKHSANPLAHAFETSKSETKPREQDMKLDKRKEVTYEAKVPLLITEESNLENALQTQESSHHDTFLSAQGDILTEYHQLHKSEHDKITTIKSVEVFIEKQIQSLQTSGEDLFTSTAIELHGEDIGVVDLLMEDNAFSVTEIQEQTTEYQPPRSFSLDEELPLDKQSGSQHNSGISNKDRILQESSLKHLPHNVEMFQSVDRIELSTIPDIKESVKIRKIPKETKHRIDMCMASDLDKLQVSHCSHFEYVSSLMTKRVYGLEPSVFFSREETGISLDSYLITSQQLSKKIDPNKGSKECVESLPNGPDLSGDRRPREHYVVDNQFEECGVEMNLLIGTGPKATDISHIGVLQSMPLLFNDNAFSLEKDVHYNNKDVEDSLQLKDNPIGQPSPHHKEQFNQENIGLEVAERENTGLEVVEKTNVAFDSEMGMYFVHTQTMLEYQRSAAINSPSTHTHDGNLKTAQDLTGFHTSELVSIHSKQEDVPVAEHCHIPGTIGTSESKNGRESNAGIQESPKHHSSVSTQGIVGSMFAETSGFFTNLFVSNREPIHSRGSEAIVHDHEANENKEASTKVKQQHTNLGDNSELIHNDITVSNMHDLATSNAAQLINDNSQVGSLNSQEKVKMDEAGKDAEKNYVILLKAFSENINCRIILNETNQDIYLMISELQQQLSKKINEDVNCLGNICKGNTLGHFEQCLSDLHNEIPTFPCEQDFMEDLEETASTENGNVLKPLCDRWSEEKIKIYHTLQNLLSDIRLKCAAQDALLNPHSVPGVAIQTTTFERNTLLKEESDQKTEQSEQLNQPLSGDGGESIYDPTLLLLANTAAPRQFGEHVKNNNADVENKHIRDLQTETHAMSSVHAQEENESTFGIMEHLKPQDILSHVSFMWSKLVAGSDKAVALLPEDLRPGPDLYGFSWEMAICAVLVGVFTVTVFLCQASKAIGSRRYIGRERELASKVAELVENKCKELEKLSIYQKEYEELELSLTDANLLKESSVTTCLEATCEKLNQSNSALNEEILTLEKELEEEKSQRSQQDGFIDEIQRRVESLEKEAMSMKAHADEARTTLKVFQINKGRLEMELRDAKEEHVHFQESNEQLLQEAEGWGERFNELTEQTKMFESSKQDMEEALNNKECQVKSLTDCLLTMKDWSAELSKENNIHDNNWEAEVTGETENGEHLDDHQKRTVKKLIFAAKLNASLKTLETERNLLYDKLSDEVKAKEELAERIDHLQKEQNSLNSENSQFEFDVQKLQQKLKVMTEMYQENELKLHRKLTVEEKHRLQKEEKLSKVDEKIYHAAEELHNYRTRAKDLEEELEKTIRSYQSQISSHEKKGHDNWLTARAAERQLNDIKKENAHNRQKLTELEFKLEQMEKDPYALDVPRGFGRENSPYGPSPLGRPSPETRAFLSPPTLLEGPLRISPMLPGGERGSRSPGDNADYSNTSERTETGSDRVSDHQGANSDHGSLSPPWERDRRLNVQASGQHYPDPSFHPRRQEKYFHNPPISGRFSGPADLLRGYNMHSFEKTDGQLSAENSSLNETNRNGANENHGNVINVADHLLQPENEAVGPCFVPPPQLMRGPLLPMDPRGPFLRRVSPFPPRIMDVYGPRDYFSVPNYSGLPRHPIGMRHPFPSQPFLHFPPLQRPGFLPPPPPENRTEQSTGLTYAPKASDAENPNPHQET